MSLFVQKGVGGEAQDVGFDQMKLLISLGFQVAKLMYHVGHQPSISFSVGVDPELQSRRSGALIVVKKIGALSPKSEDVAPLSQDRIGVLTQSLPQRIFSKNQMTDL